MCIDQAALTARVRGSCADTVIHSLEGSMSGVLLFGDTTVTQTIVGSLLASQTIPASCLSGFTCEQLAATMTDLGRESSCTTNGDDCDCQLEIPLDNEAMISFSVDGSELTLAGVVTNDFCVDGTTLSMQDNRPNGEPAVYTLRAL